MIDEALLLAELRPWMRAKAASLLGDGERHHAEDLAQEAWIQVWKVLPTRPASITEHTELLAWCRAVALNRMRNVRRKEIWQTSAVVRNGVPVGDRIFELAEALYTFTGVDAASEVAHAYHAGRVAQALDALPPRQREYVVARFFHGTPTTILQKEFSPRTWPQAKKRLVAALAA